MAIFSIFLTIYTRDFTSTILQVQSTKLLPKKNALQLCLGIKYNFNFFYCIVHNILSHLEHHPCGRK
jgi:hypothetical protein